MKAILFLTLIFVALVAAADEPRFCHRLNCPEYTLVSSNGSIEIRQYQASWWASTNISAFDLNEAGNIGFHRLFDYISGDNDGNVKIPMTTPVLTEIFPGQGPFCASTFIVSFYVPWAYQNGGAPTPTSPDVYLSQLPARQVAVDQFAGFANWDSTRQTASQLASYLNSQKIPYSPLLSLAQYDSPFDIIDRHNEVWYTVLN
jgi:hypothetical protein